jgi:hypothetical protein
MFRQLLARLFPRHRLGPHEPPCDTVFGEVYRAHATFHGPNKLLPVDALPDPPERPRTSEVRGRFELT